MALSPVLSTSDLDRRVGDHDRLLHLANGIEANIEDAIRVATAMFREAAVIQYTEESVDALTPATINDAVRWQLASLALDILTAGNDGRPPGIDNYGALARTWLSWLAGGKVVIDDLILLTTTGTGDGLVSYRAKARRFDRTDDYGNSSDYDFHDPELV